jgi:hypothetical protein
VVKNDVLNKPWRSGPFRFDNSSRRRPLPVLPPKKVSNKRGNHDCLLVKRNKTGILLILPHSSVRTRCHTTVLRIASIDSFLVCCTYWPPNSCLFVMLLIGTHSDTLFTLGQENQQQIYPFYLFVLDYYIYLASCLSEVSSHVCNHNPNRKFWPLQLYSRWRGDIRNFLLYASVDFIIYYEYVQDSRAVTWILRFLLLSGSYCRLFDSTVTTGWYKSIFKG